MANEPQLSRKELRKMKQSAKNNTTAEEPSSSSEYHALQQDTRRLEWERDVGMLEAELSDRRSSRKVLVATASRADAASQDKKTLDTPVQQPRWDGCAPEDAAAKWCGPDQPLGSSRVLEEMPAEVGTWGPPSLSWPRLQVLRWQETNIEFGIGEFSIENHPQRVLRELYQVHNADGWSV